MMRPAKWGFWMFATAALCVACQAAEAPSARQLPPPATSETDTMTHHASAVFAGGCFWGVQSIFQHVRGVTATRAGYDGGARADATYETVSTGGTGHAESVEVEYDPTVVSYGTLMRLFFSVALDPTQVNRQFPDVGSQYRSVLFVRNQEQAEAARTYIRQLDETHVFARPIATQIVPDHGFFPAEEEHQNFAERNPGNPYILTYDC
ncbi:peptide-methionine (S)-S-oxide reductase MsrA [Acetobacter pasteurianus]|uniref:peptide-methionine (S)-S-oxide reductase MsrA n=1 Tax=Acetobacter pasteurianus TaxID=438 RepID=UPI00031A84FF|nr:peptide-methionine (S)-S-oxide reductase MsrA [Acetobacter pasteurianus]GCD50951.1 methionine sulfoxide reductase A [Acetobacter pasteurianus subsp. pasteurianus LMG 1262 = NBRC 106471]